MPARGVLIAATFTARGVASADAGFPNRALPLPLEAAEPVPAGLDPIPLRRALARYRLLAAVGRYNVDARIYFGTSTPSRAQRAVAQNQLDRLFVGTERITLLARPAIRGRNMTVTRYGSVDRPEGRRGDHDRGEGVRADGVAGRHRSPFRAGRQLDDAVRADDHDDDPGGLGRRAECTADDPEPRLGAAQHPGAIREGIRLPRRRHRATADVEALRRRAALRAAAGPVARHEEGRPDGDGGGTGDDVHLDVGEFHVNVPQGRRFARLPALAGAALLSRRLQQPAPDVSVTERPRRSPRRCSTTSRRSSTGSARRSSSCSRRSRAAGTCCSKTCPARRRRCSPARSPDRSRARPPRASSARPTCSRPTSRASRCTTRGSASSSSGRGRSSRTSCSSTRSTARCRRRSPRCSRRWPRGRSRSTARRARCRIRSSCSRPRTRSSRRGRSRSRRLSSTASSSRPRSATRARRTRS